MATLNDVRSRYYYANSGPDKQRGVNRMARLLNRAGLEIAAKDTELSLLRSMPDSLFGGPISHFTVLEDPFTGKLYVLAEPWGAAMTHIIALKATGLPYFKLPAHLSPFGGNSASYLITFPWQKMHLDEIKTRL